VRREQLINAISQRIARYTNEGDRQSILAPAAVREAEELLALTPDPAGDIDVCYFVGGLYWCRWGEQGNGQDSPDFRRTIDLMVHVHRERPELVPRMLADLFDKGGATTGALRAGAASNEGKRLFEEHQRTGDRPTLDEAVALLRKAAHSADTDPERRLHNAMAFALALHRTFQLDGDPRVAGELISWLRGVLAGKPSEPTGFQGLLVSALTYRFAATSDPKDLDDAVAEGERLFAATDEAHLRSTVCMATGLWLQHNGNSERAAEVAELALACLAPSPVGSEDRIVQASTVVTGLMAAIDREPALVDPAIDLYRELSTSAGADSANARRGLLIALRHRYQARALPADLDECVGLGRWAVAAVPASDPAHWSEADALSTDLGTRFRATDRREDLDEAIALGRQVVAAAPEGSYINNLAAWLADRYQVTDDPADLEEAVELLRRAVAADPASAGPLRNLATALELKHRRTGEFAALDEAQALYRRAASL
jgi:tetratricopeptide (TPR) repeat protein